MKEMVVVVLFCLQCSALFADTSTIPGAKTNVVLSVREQPVQQFVNTLFSQIDIPVVVSEDIVGMVNGKFEGAFDEVFTHVAKAFNVTVYFDGVVAHVYNANETSRVMMPLSNSLAKRVEQLAVKLEIGDTTNHVDSSSNGVLMVTGTRRYMEQIEELSFAVQSNVQAAVAPIAYRVFYLKNAWADDTSFEVGRQSVLIRGVATLLRDLVSDGQLPIPGKHFQPRSSTLQGLRGQGLLTVSEPVHENSSQRDTATSVSNEKSSISDGKKNFTTARIVADARLNAIIIRDNADRMTAYQALINDLDRASSMVEIEATIIDINTDKTRELGVGWQYRQQDGEFSLQGGAGSQLGQVSPDSTIQGPGAILSLMLGDRAQFLSRIRALEEIGAAKIVSKPHVITLSDVEAVLGATSEFFIRVAGQEEVDLFNVPVGITLRVTPHVFQEEGQGRIKLLINIEDGARSSQLVDQIPVIERATISTQAVVNDGESLLIGGLVRDEYRQVASQVPLLGSIPILGRLFKSTANKATRVERLFLITPRTAEGVGFGPSRGGQKILPTLQGDIDNIVNAAKYRLSMPEEPFGDAVEDIPFKALNVRASTTALNKAVDPQFDTPLEPAQGNWVAVPNSHPVRVTQAVSSEQAWSAVTDSKIIDAELLAQGWVAVQ